MANQTITELFRSADKDLQRANEELYRPAEDVVTYSVCVYSRRALHNFLKCLYMLYAEEHGDPVEEHLTIEDMITYCSRYDDLLKDIDFTHIACKCQEDIHEGQKEPYYCNDVRKVDYCKSLAEDVQKLVIKKGGDLIPEGS